MKDTAIQCAQTIVRVSHPGRTWRLWVRGLWKTAVHSGTGALLSGMTTNTAEMLAPARLEGIGLSGEQCLAVFGVAAFWAALRYVNQTTAPGGSEPPFQP